MKIKFLILFAMVLLVACDGNEKESKSEETKGAQERDANLVVEDRPIFNEYSARVNELGYKLSNYLTKLPMPSTGTITPLTPIKDQIASLSEDGELYIKMNFQQYQQDWDPLPVLLTVTASNEKESLMADESYVKEGDLYISENNNDIVFQEQDYWISYSSRPTNALMDAMSLDHIEAYINRSLPDHQFASILQVSSNNYKYPGYMLNEKLPITISSSIFLDDEMDYTYQKNLKHNFTVANEDMRVVQSRGELDDYGIYDIEQFKQFATPMAMNNINGYYDEMDKLGYYFSYDGLQFFIRPGQDVNQETGRVSSKYHDNWEETIEKTVFGLVGKIQKNKNNTIATGKSPLVTEDKDGFIYLVGISLKTSDNEVYDLLGAPSREEQDPEMPIKRYLIYEEEQLKVEVSEGYVRRVMLTSSDENIVEDVLNNTQSKIYQDGDYHYLVNEDSNSVLSYNESDITLYFIDYHAVMLAENENAVKIR